MKKRALFSFSLPMLALILSGCGGGDKPATSSGGEASGAKTSDSGQVTSVDETSGAETGGEEGGRRRPRRTGSADGGRTACRS